KNSQFNFYEGPPTANGHPGIHHVLSRIYKDIIPRYQTMKGRYVPRKAGWDTHGLPVELEIEKKLGLTSKPQIESYGVARFNQLCRESVTAYIKEWEALTERVGFWLDLQNAYVTMHNSYVESCWWIVGQLWKKGLVYRGHRVTPHCPRCGTSLSSHEVALGYRDNAEDPSVYIKFKVAKSLYAKPGFLEQLRRLYGDREAGFARRLLDLTGDKEAYLLAWTTTPWTLPGNTALAIAPLAEYSIVEHEQGYLILASARLEPAGLASAPVRTTVTGSELIELRYEPLFNPLDSGVAVSEMGDSSEGSAASSNARWQQTGSFNYPVIGGDFVSMEDGTGIVHVAPAYGEVDYEAGLANHLHFVHMVDLQGRIAGSYPFAGKFVKDADPEIVDILKTRGLLLRAERIVHTYPFCWRCDTPLLYYAKRTWYIRTTARKAEMMQANEQVSWYPEHIKHGRFGDWLSHNVDWAFSRERYWGTPLPIWECQECGHQVCAGSVEELGKMLHPESEVQDLTELDLHRPFVDNVLLQCPKATGEDSRRHVMRRVSEVIDCWFDSGAMPVAQWHSPFENRDVFQRSFPADFICEAIDQTRGWFYSLHAISNLLADGPTPCFRNVICLGHVLDAKGEKMSKARGNVVDPWAMLDSYGADALRWYFITSAPAGYVRYFSPEKVAEAVRRFLLTLWNSYAFFVIYANIDGFDPRGARPAVLSDLDRWILSRTNRLALDCNQSLESYDPTTAARRIEEFTDDLSTWYIRRSRRRFWKSESDADKAAAYSTLYQCLVTLTKLAAPIVPFTTEAIYRNLVCQADPDAPISVHLCDYPVADSNMIDDQLEQDMRLLMLLARLGHSARSQAGAKVRQPLGKAIVKIASEREKKAVCNMAHHLAEELNVKQVEVTTDDFGQLTGFVASEEGAHKVAVSTELTEELIAEGLAREIVRRVQTMRQKANLNI
ncbi:MAG: isoleucine--tRNA ligase, partial [Chloroflexota bacterium]